MDTLRSRLASRALAERIPLSAEIEIIATCNFSCRHCYIAPCAEREDVMSLERATELFGKLADAGTLTILLTGGEVFTHRQFADIYLAAKRSGFTVFVNSNGYLIGERWANFLAEWPPEMLSISLYGLSDSRYEKVTGIPNAFRRVVRALDLLAERQIGVELKCPAMALTVDEIPAMKAFAEARGLTFRYDTIMTPQEKGAANPVALQLSAREVMDLDERIDPGFIEFKQFATQFGGATREREVYSCGAGRTALAVNVHGGVTTCVSSRQTVGNLFEQSFDDVWAMLGGKVSRKFADGHPCARCEFRGICAGCPATVEQMTGLPEGYVQQYCQITHLRAYRAGMHATGVPRTVEFGIAAGVRTPSAAIARALPVLS